MAMDGAAGKTTVKDVTTASFKADVLTASAQAAGAGGFLGALVRPVQAARAGAGEGGRRLQGQGDARQDEHRRAPADRRPARHPVDSGRHRLRPRPARRRLHGRAAGKPGARLHRAHRRPADRRQRRAHHRGRGRRRRTATRRSRGRALRARADRGRDQRQGHRRPGAAACRGRRSRSARGVLAMAAPPAPGKEPDPGHRRRDRGAQSGRAGRDRRRSRAAAAGARRQPRRSSGALRSRRRAQRRGRARPGGRRTADDHQARPRLERRRARASSCCNSSRPGA